MSTFALLFLVVMAVMVGLAVVAGVLARRADPVPATGFALVMAVSGGAMLVGGHAPGLRLLGGGLILVGVVSAATLLLPARTNSKRPDVE